MEYYSFLATVTRNLHGNTTAEKNAAVVYLCLWLSEEHNTAFGSARPRGRWTAGRSNYLHGCGQGKSVCYLLPGRETAPFIAPADRAAVWRGVVPVRAKDEARAGGRWADEGARTCYSPASAREAVCYCQLERSRRLLHPPIGLPYGAAWRGARARDGSWTARRKD